jgi:hypothetical protein
MLMSVCVVVLTLRTEKISVLEGVFARHWVLKLQGVKLGKHHSFHPLTSRMKGIERVSL